MHRAPSIQAGAGGQGSGAGKSIYRPRSRSDVQRQPLCNGGYGSGSGERALLGASDLQASPLSEGNRRLWVMYIKGQRWAQVKRTACAFAVQSLVKMVCNYAILLPFLVTSTLLTYVHHWCTYTNHVQKKNHRGSRTAPSGT